MKILSIAAAFAVISISAEARADQQVIVPFVDGMTIQTSNAIANVEMRAQSIGPGACAVNFTASGNTISILAPPIKFSAWNVIVASLGENSITISKDVKCDTDVLAEVRYYKK